MTGQDAVTVAEKFNAAVGVDAFVLTKMDGDARGGAALSVREVTGRPIAFVGVGEKTDALEPFHPDRLAARILGMGDVLSLVEKAQAVVDQEQAEELAQEDPRGDASRSRTSRSSSSSSAPWARSSRSWTWCPFFKGAGGMPEGAARARRASCDRYEAIIASMTPAERAGAVDHQRQPARCASRGAAAPQVADVNRLLKQHAQLKKMMKGLKQMEGRMGKLKGALPFLTPITRQPNEVTSGGTHSTETDGHDQEAGLPRGGGRLARGARRAVHRGDRALQPALQPAARSRSRRRRPPRGSRRAPSRRTR